MKRPVNLPSLLSLAALLLPGCGGGCDELAEAPVQAPGPADTALPQADAQPNQAAVHRDTAALQAQLGLRLPAHTQALLLDAMPAARGPAFDPAQLNKRFWLSWGPRGLVANERPLLPAGAPTPEQLQTAVQQAIPDWQDRSGVKVQAALLVVDAAADPQVAKALYAAVASAGPWRVSALVTDPQGAPMELPLPARPARQ